MPQKSICGAKCLYIDQTTLRIRLFYYSNVLKGPPACKNVCQNARTLPDPGGLSSLGYQWYAPNTNAVSSTTDWVTSGVRDQVVHGPPKQS
jgi:hypothetical protein